MRYLKKFSIEEDYTAWKSSSNYALPNICTIGGDTVDSCEPRFNDYFHFEDLEVETIVANWIGNGIGTTLEQIKLATVIPDNLFTENTNIISFKEFNEFTGITSLPVNAFALCSNIQTLNLPNTITSLNNCSLRGLENLINLTIPTDINVKAFSNESINSNRLIGNGTGIMVINGTLSGNTNYPPAFRFNKMIINGNQTTEVRQLQGVSNIHIVKGYIQTGTLTWASLFYGGTKPKYIDVGGNISGTSPFFGGSMSGYVDVFHTSYDGVISMTPSNIGIASINMFYVGDGSSQAHDQSILDLYIADANWSSYSSKLGLWYDYNGEYKNVITI